MQYVERIRLNLDNELADKCNSIMDGHGDSAVQEHYDRLSDPRYFDMIDYIAIERSIIYRNAVQDNLSAISTLQHTVISQNATISGQLATITHLQSQLLSLRADYDNLRDDYDDLEDELDDYEVGHNDGNNFVNSILSDRATQFALKWDINNAVGKRIGQILGGGG
jgi:hypothetical protein